ncbi:class I SAM-dependent methyltransferase [Streptomyces sp. NPDC048201]|uniref:class I SAM-dependent methyltransferase n=1 Tax=Streptomyces sp. NPDC048201 TaxID=3365513 RepID=UPI003717121E
MTIDYDQIAGEYAQHRRAYPQLVEHLASLVPQGGTVAEIGCGTANHLRGIAALVDCTAVGLDPHAKMLEVAASAPAGDRARYVRGTAEDLSVLGIPAGGADLVFSVDMVHYLDDPGVYAAQAWERLRPGGYFCTATDSEWIIRNRLPMTAYFPGTIPLELARHHAIEALEEAYRAAGFTDPGTRVFGEEGTLADATRFRDKANSVMHLLPEDEWRSGLERLEADLAGGPVPSNNRTCLLTVRKPL